MKHVMFVGRWQPCHHGHVALWREGAWCHVDDEGTIHHLPALIYVRDIPPNERNPFTTDQTVQLIRAALNDAVKLTDVAGERDAINNSEIMVGPDIAAVRYGRGVGYIVEEISLSQDIQAISATEIRTKIKEGLPAWRDFVLPSVGELLLGMDW